MVKVTYMERKSIEIDESELLRLTIFRLQKLISPGEFIREKNGVPYLCMDDPDHRHGSIQEIQVRVATDLDAATLLVIAGLESLHKKSGDNRG